MVELPKPIQRSGPQLPQPIQRSGNSSSTTVPSAGASGVNVSPLSQTQNVRAYLRPPRERILLGGDTVSGKSYAVARVARKEFLRCKEQDIPRDRWPKFYMLDTDDTAPKLFSDGYEFDYLYYENGGNVYPYPAFDWDSIAKAGRMIHQQAKQGDYIWVDVINRVYVWAMERIAQLENIDITNVLMKKKGFGAFTPDQWLKVRALFDSVVDLFIFHNEANLLFVTHIKAMLDVAGRERQDLLLHFDSLGYKPEGAPLLPGKMDTIAFLWAAHKIPRDDRGARQGKAYSVRYFSLLKDRGFIGLKTRIYDMDFSDGLADVRREMREERVLREQSGESPNVTGEEGAKLLTEIVQEARERTAEAREKAADEANVEDIQPTDAAQPTDEPTGEQN